MKGRVRHFCDRPRLILIEISRRHARTIWESWYVLANNQPADGTNRIRILFNEFGKSPQNKAWVERDTE
jgi:hypothetical protein